jgi:nitroreductase
MSSVRTLLGQRTSVNHFDTERPLDEAQIIELVRLATLSPSAYNFQNWKFIAGCDATAKERLKAAAYGQQKVVDAPVTFIVCGTLNAHRLLAQVLQPALDAGILNADVVSAWVSMAQGSHEGNAQLRRDEAFRSASLAAMTLMLAAQDQGLVTGPMSGFDPAAVSSEFELQSDEVPVILVTVGYPAEGNRTQKPRRAVSEVLKVI